MRELSTAPAAWLTTLAGTPGFMSPEQARGGRVDHRADIWAFGALVRYTFGSGDLTDKPAEGGPKLQARGLGRSSRGRLQRLVSHCQQPEPADRAATMTEVRHDLDQILEEVRRAGAWRSFGKWSVAPFLLAILLGGLYLWRPSGRFVPATATASGRVVEVRGSGGKTMVFSPSEPASGELHAALVLLAEDAPSKRLVAAASGWPGPSRIYFWNHAGKPVASFAATDDSPFSPSAEPSHELYSAKALGDPIVLPLGHGRLAVVERSHYYPSVLRRFQVRADGVREVFRLYHAGHISRVEMSPGLGGSGPWTWISGRTQDGGILRAAAAGRERNTYYLGCVDTEPEGVAILPSFVVPDSAFLAGHPGGVRPADPFFYFVMRGFSVQGTAVVWEGSLGLDDVRLTGPNTCTVLLVGAIRLDLTWTEPSDLRIEASCTGELQGAMERRAALLGASRDSLIEQFLADSVFCLAEARDGLHLSGDFHDIRGSLPASWNGHGPEPGYSAGAIR